MSPALLRTVFLAEHAAKQGEGARNRIRGKRKFPFYMNPHFVASRAPPILFAPRVPCPKNDRGLRSVRKKAEYRSFFGGADFYNLEEGGIIRPFRFPPDVPRLFICGWGLAGFSSPCLRFPPIRLLGSDRELRG